MIKQEVLGLIERLPETATLEDIMYGLYVIEKHKNALAAIEKGEVLTVDEVKGLLVRQ